MAWPEGATVDSGSWWLRRIGVTSQKIGILAKHDENKKCKKNWEHIRRSEGVAVAAGYEREAAFSPRAGLCTRFLVHSGGRDGSTAKMPKKIAKCHKILLDSQGGEHSVLPASWSGNKHHAWLKVSVLVRWLGNFEAWFVLTSQSLNWCLWEECQEFWINAHPSLLLRL